MTGLKLNLFEIDGIIVALGDPLIKGLTEVASKRPADPIAYLATYLYNFANNNGNKSRGKTQVSTRINFYFLYLN